MAVNAPPYFGLLLTAGLGLGLAASATAAEPKGRAAQREAVKACESRKEGDACRFQHGDRNVEGTCRRSPRGPVACVPPRIEDLWNKSAAACKDKKPGDACSFPTPQGVRSGACRSTARGTMCRPRRP